MNLFSKNRKVDENRIISELINSYSLLIDPEKILEVTKARILDFFPIISIDILIEDNDFYQNKSLRISKNSHLINWLLVNNRYVDMKEKYREYVDSQEEIATKFQPDYIFPLTAHNKLSGIIFIKCNSQMKSANLDFLGNLFQLASLSYEATYKIKQERERYKQESQKEKMAVVGRMASYIAHEIRNPLTSIRSSIQFVGDFTEDTKMKNICSGIIEEVDRVNQLTHFISDFTKTRVINIKNVKVFSLLRSINDLYANELLFQEIKLILPSKTFEPLSIKADPEAMKQVFQNLLKNSMEALMESKTKEIRINIKKVDQKYLLEWIDSGCGIDSEGLTKIFEPFYTTKSSGSGLGLAISKKLLEDQHYELFVSSKLGKGTRFFFFVDVTSLGRSW